MALIGNYTVLNKNPGRAFAGSTVSDSRAQWNKSGPARNLFFSGMDQKTALPEGAEPPYSWLIAMVAGGMSARLTASSSISAYAVKGLSMEAAIAGSSDLTASATNIVQMTAALFGTSTVTAGMVGVVTLAATIAGNGNLTAGLSMIASMQAALSGSGSLTANLKGKANMAANIFVNSGAATTNELVAAIWSAVAANNNIAGTMGAKLNAASAAGDPWSAALPGSYVSGEAGNILAQIQTLVGELHKLQGLDAAAPMTVTPNSRIAGDIELEISESGTDVTVSRV